MKKVFIHTVKFNKLVVNLVLAFIVSVVGGYALVVGINSVPASTIDGVYYSGNTSGNKVCLMINVYWGTEYIESMLDVFDEYNVKTTFFVGGTWAVLNEECLKEIYSRGHEIANHGYHHKDQNKLSYSENVEEIKTTHNIVKNLLGVEMNLFAPPSGSYSKTTVSASESLGYKTIMWTRDTIDWRDKDASLIYSRAIKNASGGDLILAHPTEKTLEALPKILEYFQNNNLVQSTVSEVLE